MWVGATHWVGCGGPKLLVTFINQFTPGDVRRSLSDLGQVITGCICLHAGSTKPHQQQKEGHTATCGNGKSF